VTGLICQLLYVYVILLFGRVILSWFPLSPGSALVGVYSFLFNVTEPVLAPLRRVIPPLGGFDLSPIIVFFGIQILQRAICG
jgi:YggT family protein